MTENTEWDSWSSLSGADGKGPPLGFRRVPAGESRCPGLPPHLQPLWTMGSSLRSQWAGPQIPMGRARHCMGQAGCACTRGPRAAEEPGRPPLLSLAGIRGLCWRLPSTAASICANQLSVLPPLLLQLRLLPLPSRAVQTGVQIDDWQTPGPTDTYSHPCQVPSRSPGCQASRRPERSKVLF